MEMCTIESGVPEEVQDGDQCPDDSQSHRTR
jgi:hypothetical protein